MDCHGFDFTEGDYGDVAGRHEGVVADPSAHGVCDECHAEIAALTANSLHSNQWGYKTAIDARCGGCPSETYEDGFQADCASCHTTCGQCHVSYATSVGGGLFSAHKFRPTPHVDQCTSCHGSRIGFDYFGPGYGGNHQDNVEDVHLGMGFLCGRCHFPFEDAGHGDGMSDNPSGHYESRYEVKSMPRCENCHDRDNIAEDNADNPDWNGAYHERHWAPADGVNLQCQVCHSQSYQNCYDCHAGGESETVELALKIGHNPISDLRDYDYVVLRHVPVTAETYSPWGLGLPNFDALPTWTYASPHNIKRWTEQTTPPEGGGCATSCHDRAGQDPRGFYLREADIAGEPDEAANLGVVITESDLH